MFKQIENQRVYKQVADQIQQLILEGKLRCGDRLPAERVLAEELNVSRASIREAIRALDILGIIESRQGGGNYICSEFSGCLLEPMSMLFKLQNGTFLELLELRCMLESAAVSLCAQKMPETEKVELGEIIEQLAEAKSEADRVRLDAFFHQKIIEGSGNLLFGSLYKALASLMQGFVKEARKLLKSKELSSKLLAQHRAVYRAVRQGKAEKASEEIRKHFQLVIDNLR